MGRQINKGSIERVSAFRPGSCQQANVVGDLWPEGFDVDADPAAAMVAFKAARAMGLDLVFVAVTICQPEELAEFRNLCLSQLSRYIAGRPAQVMAATKPDTEAHEAALHYQTGSTAATMGSVYTLAMAARKTALRMGSKAQEKRVREAQLDHFEEKLARIVAGEKAPILGVGR